MNKPDAALLQLMQEVTEAKQAVQAALQLAPEDVQLHRIHGMYTGHILDIRKAALQETAADRDQLLIDALKGVVSFLIQHGEATAAQFVGEHLEEIGNRIKLTWQDTQPSPDWLTATRKSAGSSK
ncbi:MAG: hypothetical protein GWM98_29885, partial [Nitrospinaceae bacterium]|nr:hypothetical protein [Nitrospinaceae bacterium]NIR57907.1 hypothetical protein [Nitrospinaceae bacterium]NIS88365.1 hypothetical protein [Nitrospinaceae bacterium]NIT85243.1 hypothetical protein [Nitrospinaceae bacterium]NIU47396.1 hypothetical protein [Nitrospinaceae bacterium]